MIGPAATNPDASGNSGRPDGAARLVAQALGARAPAERGRFLRELMAHATAGLVILEGEGEASESVYRLADAVVARGARP